MIGFDPRLGQKIFLLAPASRLALKPTQPPIQWVPGVLSLGVKHGWGVTLTTHPHLLPSNARITTQSYISKEHFVLKIRTETHDSKSELTFLLKYQSKPNSNCLCFNHSCSNQIRRSFPIGSDEQARVLVASDIFRV
jgi:hypothetical protein